MGREDEYCRGVQCFFCGWHRRTPGTRHTEHNQWCRHQKAWIGALPIPWIYEMQNLSIYHPLRFHRVSLVIGPQHLATVPLLFIDQFSHLWLQICEQFCKRGHWMFQSLLPNISNQAVHVLIQGQSNGREGLQRDPVWGIQGNENSFSGAADGCKHPAQNWDGTPAIWGPWKVSFYSPLQSLSWLGIDKQDV